MGVGTWLSLFSAPSPRPSPRWGEGDGFRTAAGAWALGLGFRFFSDPSPRPSPRWGEGDGFEGPLAWALGLGFRWSPPPHPGPLPGGEREQEEEYRLAAESPLPTGENPNVRGLRCDARRLRVRFTGRLDDRYAECLHQSEDHGLRIVKDVIISDPDHAQSCDILQIVLTLTVGIAPVIMAAAI